MTTTSPKHLRIASMNPRIEQWGQWQRAQGNSERTITSRVQLLTLFERHAGIDAATATTEHVVEFMASTKDRALSKSTRASYFSHLRAWFRWLVRSGARDDDPMVVMMAPKLPRRRPRPVSDEQLATILAIRMHRRSQMMVRLACFQGLRVHEIAKVRGEDIDLLAMEIRVIGKGEEDVRLPLHPMVAVLATQFPRRGYWFVSHTGNVGAKQHILGKSVSDILANIMTRAGIDGGGHRLRHWLGSKLVEEGVNIRIIQELLRHQSLTSTQIYTQVTMEQQRKALGLLKVSPQPTDPNSPDPGPLALVAA